MANILETDRLVLRHFTTDDTKFIIELVNSPGWLEFIGDRNIRSDEQAKSYLENGPIKSYEEHGFGLSMVAIKESGEPIGMCGLLKRETLENPDIGFAFLPRFTGKGYAFEISHALLTYAAKELQLPCICAITLPNNTRSIKLLEKIGLTFKKNITSPGNDKQLMLFSNL